MLDNGSNFYSVLSMGLLFGRVLDIGVIVQQGPSNPLQCTVVFVYVSACIECALIIHIAQVGSK